MQTFKITLTNVTSHETREVQVEAVSVELAHKDVYFHHADKYEDVVSIVDSNGDVLYTEEGGFSTMPQQPPPTSHAPDVDMTDIMRKQPGKIQRESEKVNFL